MAYDRQFRREALARRSLDWSTPDPRLYSEAFTGRARSIPRCSVCLQNDHQVQNCPLNPDRPWWAGPPGAVPWSMPPVGQSQGMSSSSKPSRKAIEVCQRFNEGRCRHPTCQYIHTCSECNGNHPVIHCGRVRQRDRSPLQPTATQAQGQSGWPRR